MKNQDKTVQTGLLKQNSENLGSKSASFSAISQSGQRDNPGNPASQASGPQFGLKDKGDWGEKSKGWLNKYGSSVILPIIALLILAGGIYLYASQKSQEKVSFPPTEEMTAGLVSPKQEETTSPSQEETTIPTEGKISQEEMNKEKIIKEIVPEGRKEGKIIIEKAVKGDGVTHLARRALRDYLKGNPKELTKEHKIYIEDYLKDRIGSKQLAVDEEISFSEDLIKEAIDASLQLSQSQLNALEKYSALVVSW